MLRKSTKSSTPSAIAIGRKNYMFVGSERGGNSVAIMQTAARVMHDYHYIRVARNNYRRLTPVQTAAIHLDQERQDQALVVMRLGHDITISAFSV